MANIKYYDGAAWQNAVSIDAIGTDGWTAMTETLTYASATTFTVPTDLTARFQKGTKLKLTQTTVKYFYVTASAYVNPNTTVTITAGTSYTFANAAVTSPYYSYIENPQGFPGYFNYTPVWSAVGAMTYAVDTLYYAEFTIHGRMVNVNLKARGTIGGTLNHTVYATLPVEALRTAASNNPVGTAYVSFNTTGGATGFSFITAGTPDLFSFRKYSSANWETGNNSDCCGTIVYQME